MGKAILMSIQPKWVAKILNGEKTIEIRKKFPKDYVGWVYIYCTKGKPNLWLPYEYDCFELDEASQPYISNEPILDIDAKMNGKVVAKFWCDKVEEIYFQIHCDGTALETDNMSMSQLLKSSCLRKEELHKYLFKEKYKFGKTYGYAIHISKVEVFDKPKELKQKAPQNYFYIEEAIFLI